MKAASKKVVKVRGASMVEYAVLLFGVLIAAAGAIKMLGPRVHQAASDGTAHLAAPSQ